ncbi:MAG: polyprenyl diphosphate synthase [Parachlamydiales bacterium]|jgi:undecaprenyl diphosphate synthase
MQPLFIEAQPETTFFTAEQMAAVDLNNVPRHIAIVLDGNRRWANSNGETHVEGHQKGADILLDILRSAKELTIETVTVYGFSTENWGRPREEVEAVLWLIEQYTIEQRPQMLANGVKVTCIGDVSEFPDTLQKALEDTVEATAHCTDIHFVMALNYGARKEICRAANCIAENMRQGKIPETAIDEKLLASYLDTHDLPDLDLFIRPGGQLRMSNFLLWQASYSELYFLDKMWPDFTPYDLYVAVLEYQKRIRRLGT